MKPGLCGRDAELAALDLALEDALAGHTRFVLLNGEAGIGKTRLAEEFARRAATRGCTVAWGRCWEAGGAPSFWPWLEVLRALTASEATPDWLAEFLPELRTRGGGRGPLEREDREDARFRLFEYAARALADAASPCLIVLDDLHVADPLSVLFMNFLARTRRNVPCLVLGTYRDAEVSSDLAPTLAKVARESDIVCLARLDAGSTARLVQAHARRNLSDETLRKVYETTEGNPLFVGEIGRLLATRGEAVLRTALFPEGIREAIREHLARLNAPVRELLGIASVFGREFSVKQLGEVSGATSDQVRAGVDEALRAGVLSESEATNARCRFAHILVREHLYGSLPSARVAELHAAIGALLEREHGEAPGDHSALLAHHFLQAAPVLGTALAVSHGLLAAEYALEQLAYEDAAALYARVLDALGAEISELRRAELLIAQGEAELSAGQLQRGRATCARACAAARAALNPELMARGALAYASDYTHGTRDEEMVRLLSEALQALGEGDSLLRARVGARLSNALLPTLDIGEAARIGGEAIAMARRLGDPETLFLVHDAAAAAVSSAYSPAQRIAYVREGIALGAAVQGSASFHGRAFLAVTLYIAGAIAEGDAAIVEFDRLASECTQPRVATWRATLCALRASARGQYGEVARYATELERIDETRDYAPARQIAERTRLLLAIGRGDTAEIELMLARFTPTLPYEFAVQAWMRACTGKRDEALNTLHLWDCLPLSGGSPSRQNLSRVVILSEVVILAGDRERAERVLELLEPHASEGFTWGLMAGYYLGSFARRMGSLAALLERWDDAERHFEQALACDAPAELQLAHSELAFAEALRTRARAVDATRVRNLAARAQNRFERFGISAFARRAEALTGPAPARPGVLAQGVTLAREGEYWTLSNDRTLVRLKDSKGLAYLERLLQNPGREFHVLELASDLDARAASDLGDAGALLDPEAKLAYRRRVSQLNDALEEAQSFGDTARAARASEELDAIAQHLAEAVGLGGQDRRAASAAERARVNVQKRLRGTIARIELQDRAIGRYLDAAVKTGTYCVFEPP